jgi:hypothetical protein
MTTTPITHIGGPTACSRWAVAAADRPDLRPPGRRYSFGWGSSSRKLTGPAITPRRPRPSRRRASQSRPPRRQPRQRRPGPAPSGWRRPHHHRRRPAGRQRPRPPAMGDQPLLEAPGRPTFQVTATPCRHGPPLSRPIARGGGRLRPGLGGPGPMGPCGSPATPCSTTASARSPTASRSTPPCSTWDACASRSPGRVRYSMTAREAVQLCRRVRPRTAIPVHYEGWTTSAKGDVPSNSNSSRRQPTSAGASNGCPSAPASASPGNHTSRGPGGRSQNA